MSAYTLSVLHKLPCLDGSTSQCPPYPESCLVLTIPKTFLLQQEARHESQHMAFSGQEVHPGLGIFETKPGSRTPPNKSPVAPGGFRPSSTFGTKPSCLGLSLTLKAPCSQSCSPICRSIKKRVRIQDLKWGCGSVGKVLAKDGQGSGFSTSIA